MNIGSETSRRLAAYKKKAKAKKIAVIRRCTDASWNTGGNAVNHTSKISGRAVVIQCQKN